MILIETVVREFLINCYVFGQICLDEQNAYYMYNNMQLYSDGYTYCRPLPTPSMGRIFTSFALTDLKPNPIF